MTSLDGKNQFSMECLHLPKPGNSKPSISIMLGRFIMWLKVNLYLKDLQLLKQQSIAFGFGGTIRSKVERVAHNLICLGVGSVTRFDDIPPL